MALQKISLSQFLLKNGLKKRCEGDKEGKHFIIRTQVRSIMSRLPVCFTDLVKTVMLGFSACFTGNFIVQNFFLAINRNIRAKI